MESRARVRESRWIVEVSRAIFEESRGRRRVSVNFLDVSTAWVRESVDEGLTGGWGFAARQTPQQIRKSISSLLINNRGFS